MAQQEALLDGLLSGTIYGLLREQEVLDAENAYPLVEYVGDVQAGLFEELSERVVEVDPLRRQLQRRYLTKLKGQLAAFEGDSAGGLGGLLGGDTAASFLLSEGQGTDLRGAVRVNLESLLDQVEAAHPALLEKISDRIRRRYEWTCQMAQEQPGLVAFLSVDPIMGQEAMVAEVKDKIDRGGARGLKIHPGEGRFFPDDPSLQPVYEVMVERGLPIISHRGLDIANPDPSYTRPAAFAGVAEQYPDLKLVIAHLGNNFFDESAEMALKYPNIFFDTSAVITGDEKGEPLIKENALSNSEAVQLIRKIGVERVMFGSDFPWFHPHWDLKRFLKLDLTDAEKEALLRKTREESGRERQVALTAIARQAERAESDLKRQVNQISEQLAKQLLKQA